MLDSVRYGIPYSPSSRPKRPASPGEGYRKRPAARIENDGYQEAQGLSGHLAPGKTGNRYNYKPSEVFMSSELEKEIAYRVRYLVASGKSHEEAVEIANTELLTVELAPVSSATARAKSKKAKYQRAAARALREIPNITMSYR